MKLFSSLFAKILLWSLLYLILVASVLTTFFAFQSHIDLGSLLGRQASDRIRIAADLIAHDLNQSPEAAWPKILSRHSNIYQVDFLLLFKDGLQISPADLSVPAIVREKALATRHTRSVRENFFSRFKHDRNYSEEDFDHHFHDRRKENRDHSSKDRVSRNNHQKERPGTKFMMRTTNPVHYWTGIWIPVVREPTGPVHKAMLLAVSDSATGNGFFFDPLPWIVVAAGIILISIVIWIPFVRHITGPLAHMTEVAEEIACGRFDVRIKEQRRDEIGRLGITINNMTSRLHGFINGQKRFLGDVAHELASPIARIQLGLGILEQQVDKKSRGRVQDVIEDVTHMAELINELLSFSRAELGKKKISLELTELLPVIQRAVQREQTTAGEIIYRIEPDIKAIADPELLTRALANLIRNSMRYAGDSGPIYVSARKQRNKVLIEVRDSGSGVPEDLLNQLFEPFFRPEPARDRSSGGVGLGLAIVKSCVEACQGTVTAKNCQPAGFAVTIALPDQQAP